MQYYGVYVSFLIQKQAQYELDLRKYDLLKSKVF